MKLKEVPRTATFAWCPTAKTTPLIATGTAAGAIDPDFSGSTQLELWKLDLSDRTAKGFEATPSFALDTDARFNALDFSKDGQHLAGGLENGSIAVWNVNHEKPNASLVNSHVAHSGAIAEVAFNPIEPTKFVSGGVGGQVFVWDIAGSLNDPEAPGQASGRHDDVSCVAWNNKVGHILASSAVTGFTSIWDLKKRREVIHLHYQNASGARIGASAVKWHPTNSTKLVTTSNDDNTPVVLLWDLRNANKPEQVLEGHTRGLLSVDWCAQDPGFLLTSGKDNRTLLWNPVKGELLGEYPISVEWAFKTRFHPTMPDLIASASFGGLNIQTLQDTNSDSNSAEQSAKRNQSGNDDFWEGDVVVNTVHPQFSLLQSPAWLVAPSSVKFGFGGKLVTVKNKSVKITQITDNSFSEETQRLSNAVRERDLAGIVENSDTTSFDWKLLASLVADEDILDKYAPNAKLKVEAADDSESVFSQTMFQPSGEYKLFGGSHDLITKLVVTGHLRQAVEKMIDDGDVGDALLLASFSRDEDVRQKAQNAYLSTYAIKRPFLRAAWAVAGPHLEDVASNSNLDSWQHTLSILLGHSDSRRWTALLGKRLLEKGRRNDALLVFLAGGNAGPAASLWLAELPQVETELSKQNNESPYVAHVKALHQVIEKIFVVNRKTGSIHEDDGHALFEAYRDYANVVASQGDLEFAKVLLDMLPSKYQQDKDRVAAATKKTTQPVSSRPTGKRTDRGLYNSTKTAGGAMAMPGLPAGNLAMPRPPAPSVTSTGLAPQTNQYGTVTGSQPQAQPSQPYSRSAPRQSPAQSQPINHYAPSSATASPYGGDQTLDQANRPFAGPTHGSATRLPSQTGLPPQTFNASVPPPPPISSAPAPPSATIQQPKHGWNDIPDLTSTRRRAAPHIIPPPFSATQAPPKAGSLRPASPPSVRPQAQTPVSVPVNPYAPKQVARDSDSLSARASPYEPPANQASSGMARAGPYGGQGGVTLPVAQQQAPPSTHPTPGPPPPGPAPARHLAPPPAPRPTIPSPSMANANLLPTAATAETTAAASLAAASQPPPKQPTPQTPAEPKSFKFPAGDRSQLDPSAKQIYNIFTAELKRIEPAIAQQFPKQYSDTQRRVNILFDNLNNGVLIKPNTVKDLTELATALSTHDFATASSIQQAIHTTRSEECGVWMTGLKRLIEMGNAVPT